ncbi:hypothetical protein M0804_009937 [Polistes exclamans]|nr:hypothetical protein M0804_009937 [Polistes exclamans]
MIFRFERVVIHVITKYIKNVYGMVWYMVVVVVVVVAVIVEEEEEEEEGNEQILGIMKVVGNGIIVMLVYGSCWLGCKVKKRFEDSHRVINKTLFF